MQQHLMQMQPMMATYYSNSITTDHIQQYLDENKALILKIVESQNSGKINECVENQARLQRNLMYLAAIADSQPPMHSQYAASTVMSPTGGHYMQHQQAQAMTPQALIAARSSMLYSQQQPYAALQQQPTLQPQMGMSSFQGELNTSAGFSDFGQATTSKQDMGSSGSGSAEAHADESENLYLKSLDDGN